ncbi:hypothetical protein SDJN03_16476, partial [Cucurbita argyrosperma subsp. sororia]
MHRSSSTSRNFDEYSVDMPPGFTSSPPLKNEAPDDLLPLFKIDTPKKEMGPHFKPPGQNAVHLIPLILLLSALILWICSSRMVFGCSENSGKRKGNHGIG